MTIEVKVILENPISLFWGATNDVLLEDGTAFLLEDGTNLILE